MLENLLYSEGQTYKIGMHGKVYVEREGEWCRSNNFDVEQFNIALRKQNGKNNANNN